MVEEIQNLRFLSQDGQFISSPEGHQHADVVRENKLSEKDGFYGVLDIICKGFAVIAVAGSLIMVTHVCKLTRKQELSLAKLRDTASSYEIIISQEDAPEL